MAKKMKPEGAAAPKGVAANELKRVVKDILRHKQNASENAGLAGQATAQAVDQYGLDRKALTLVVGLSKAEPSKAQGTLRAIVDYADKLGMFDQIDAFDDLIPAMRRIIERAENQVAPENAGRERDGVMDSLISGEPAPVH